MNSIFAAVQASWQFLTFDHRITTTLFALLVLSVDIIRRRRLWWPEQAIRSCIANLGLMLSNNYIGQVAFFLMIWAQASYDHFGFPHLDSAVWAFLPSWAMVLIAILAMDFCDYWNHRLLHGKWLWPIHSIHHSDPHVTVLTTARVHVLESFVMKLSYILLLGWLGFPPGVLGGAGALLLVHNMYTHIHVDWSHGPLRYLVASPRFHRWHHANTPEAFNKNLANVFPFYDLAFGTYYVPGPCHAETGADGVPTHDVMGLIAWPFVRWAQMLAPLVPARLAGWRRGLSPFSKLFDLFSQ